MLKKWIKNEKYVLARIRTKSYLILLTDITMEPNLVHDAPLTRLTKTVKAKTSQHRSFIFILCHFITIKPTVATKHIHKRLSKITAGHYKSKIAFNSALTVFFVVFFLHFVCTTFALCLSAFYFSV